ncbi:hypothetical protein ACPW96_22645, partial [Micromonospora sp. DT81.3]
MRTPQAHTARENRPFENTLEDRGMPVQAQLAAAWTSLMFLVIYIDYFHLYQPGEIDEIRGGVPLCPVSSCKGGFGVPRLVEGSVS